MKTWEMGGREFAAGALYNLKYPTANESSLSAKELESGTVMSPQSTVEAPLQV